jgi:hypothetical protein
MYTDGGPVYAWKGLDITNNNINITSSIKGAKPGEVNNHKLGFFGSRSNYFEVYGNVTIKGYLITLTKYNLTNHAFNYYTDLNNQLSSSQRLFDPVASQVKGNIRNITQIDRPVLGIFDVCFKEQFFYFYTYGKSIIITPKSGFPGLTPEGYIRTIPDFWPFDY